MCCHKLRESRFVWHAIYKDIKVIKDHFNFDIEALDLVVATIDTQVLAAESGHVNGPWRISLRDLLCRYEIDEKYLHNAENDTVCTMIAAILMATGIPRADPSVSYQELKRFHQTYSHLFMIPRFDMHIYCELYESTNHCAGHHNTRSFFCSYCRENGLLYKNFRSHSTSKSLEGIKTVAKAVMKQDPDSDSGLDNSPPWYSITCPLCIESMDPSRHMEVYAYSHLEKNCLHKSTNSQASISEDLT
jgi:hypothetical protein